MNKFIGAQIGSYRIEFPAGSGSSGDVYQAQDSQSGRTTAVKLLYPHLVQNVDYHQKVLLDAPAISRLKHANIARVFTIEEAKGILFQASEWIVGETVGQLFQHQAVTNLALAANLIEQAADGLAYAHRQGVVHGGLHPHNLLLKSTGGAYPWQVILTDFRLTALLNGEPPRALLPYMAPEQATGRRDDGRSDIYALGVILYEATTRRLPHQPQTAAQIRALSQPTSPRVLRPDMPPSLEKIILKAISANVTDRYRTMEEFLHVIRQEAADLPHKATEAAASPPTAPWQAAPTPAVAAAITATPLHPVSPGDEVIAINHPQEKTRYFGLKKWLITIGQMAGNDLVLPGEGVAAKHARLERTETGWQVVDMGSRIGTFLENSRLLPDVPEPWREGQTLRIGPYLLTWSNEPITADPEPSPIAAPPPVEIQALPGLHLKLSPSLVSTAPGSPAPILLELENQTNSLVELNLRVEGIPADWLAAEAAPIRLVAQQRVKVPAMLRPPRHSSATAGVHRYQIFATPTYGAAETAVAQGQLNVTPLSQYFAEIDPLPLRHNEPGKVTVHNEGNTPERYTLSALDPDHEVEFGLPQNSLDLQPGQADSVSIVAAGRKRPFIVKQNIIPLELHVQTNTSKLVEKGRVIIPPRIPLLLLALLLLPILFITLYVGRWYLCQAPVKFMDDPYKRLCPAATAIIAAQETPTAVPVPTTAAVERIETPETEQESATEIPLTTAPAIAAEYFEIGRSTQGLPIMAAKLGGGLNPVLFVGGIHAGYAPASVGLAEDLIAYLEENPGTIPAGVTVYVVPKLNPDSENVPGDGRYNANGVDLNRNWQCNWAAMDGRGGSEPVSEAESQALNNFIVQVNPVAVIFWNAPLQANNQRTVSPGKCQVEQDASEKLAKLYASEVSYDARQANLGGSVTGDITDSLADQGLASIFVLLHSQTDANINEHLSAIERVLATFDQ